MEKEMYQSMYETETYHWYFKSKYEIVLSALEKAGLRKASGAEIVDFGCGCGLMLENLLQYGNVVGVDFSEDALQYCRMNFNGELIQADIEKYNAINKYDYAVALDVLEHVECDEIALKNIYNALREGGVCIITVPALMCLWSQHDENCMHRRRYDKKMLEKRIKSCGFDIEYLSYYNFWSFLPVWLIRKVENLLHLDNRGSKLEYGFKKGGVINDTLYHIYSSEKRRITKGKEYPWGVSLICIAKKVNGVWNE